MDDPRTMRVSADEAARLLRIEKGSVKKCLQRGKPLSEKDAKDRIWVYVDRPENAHDEFEDESDTGWDEQLEDLREQVLYLWEQLERERDTRTEERRQDTFIARLSVAHAAQTRTIRQLEAPEQASSLQASEEVRVDSLLLPRSLAANLRRALNAPRSGIGVFGTWVSAHG